MAVASSALVVLEGLARVFSSSQKVPTPAAQRQLLTQWTEQINFTSGQEQALRFHPWFFWIPVSGMDWDGLPVFSDGMVGTTLSQPQLPGALRILCLGDEALLGGVRPWPVSLVRLSRLAPQGPKLDVANAGIPLASSVQVLRRAQDLASLRPNIYIVMESRWDREAALLAPDQFLGWRGIAGWISSQVTSRLVLFQKRAPSRDEPLRRVSSLKSQQVWRALLAQAQSQRAAVLVITHPLGRGSLGYDGLIPILREHQERNPQSSVDILDLQEDFRRRNMDFLADVDSGLLKPAGHQLISRLILGRLAELGYISRKELEAAIQSAWYDSSAPDYLNFDWEVQPAIHTAAPGTTWTATVKLKNLGQTRLLSQNRISRFRGKPWADVGGISLHARHATISAPHSVPMEPLLLVRDLFPGEATTWEATFQAPQEPGQYALEIYLKASNLGPLEDFGGPVTTTTLVVR
jgi:hypothetical protein